MKNEILSMILGILIPFFGTCLGSAAVFLFGKGLLSSVRVGLYGMAGGVMLAASVWSLILPALETSGSPFPAVLGLITAFLLFAAVDLSSEKGGRLGETGRLALAVTVHNVPEGMAVGVIFAAALQETGLVPLSSAMLLSVGIALQNFPEGAVISLPLAASGMTKKRSFLRGALSGAVEPLGALVALLLTRLVAAVLPFLLSFAAGAMIYVVSEEIVPEFHKEKRSPAGALWLAMGFCLMMALDVLFG